MVQIDRADPRVLGQRLIEARKARGATQQEAAAHLGCSRPTLIAIEKGTRPVKPDELIRLAAFYGRRLHELVRPGPPTAALEPHLRAAVDASRGGQEELAEAIAEFQRFVDDYRELERIAGVRSLHAYPPEERLPQRANLRHFAEHLAIRERSRLRLGDQPVLNLREVLENSAGLHVFYGGLPSGIAGMYAFVADLGCCIFVNRKHPPERRRATLAHEYGHFFCDRHKPGIDYLQENGRRPINERFADAFAMSLLVPESGVRRQFLDVTAATGDFQVADICRLSNYYFVSVEAMTLRLEELGLIQRGTWNLLKEERFQPGRAKKELGLPSGGAGDEEAYPERYKYLAVGGFCQGKISEGQLARFLRCDRVTAREIVAACSSYPYVGPDGRRVLLQMPFDRSVLKSEA